MTRRNGWVFPLFSPDSDDRLSLNFHRFVVTNDRGTSHNSGSCGILSSNKFVLTFLELSKFLCHKLYKIGPSWFNENLQKLANLATSLVYHISTNTPRILMDSQRLGIDL